MLRSIWIRRVGEGITTIRIRHFFRPEWWGHIVERLENTSHLPLNSNIQHDGQHGVNLYRANFIPRLIRPRVRRAICPVLAIVLTEDQFVSPALTDEMPK